MRILKERSVEVRGASPIYFNLAMGKEPMLLITYVYQDHKVKEGTEFHNPLVHIFETHF